MSVPHIDPAQAIQKMDAGEALVVDVRQPDEHELQRIPGSLLLPLDDINAESAARVLPDKNALTYVYCRSGVRSTAACEKLEALGYTNLYNLGGLTTWPYVVECAFCIRVCTNKQPGRGNGPAVSFCKLYKEGQIHCEISSGTSIQPRHSTLPSTGTT